MSNDYFVVVQTMEAGNPVLSVVPHKWVVGTTLHWPPKQAKALRQNAGSTPSPTWTKMSCAVKRRFIPTFREAEEEIDNLSGLSTDASDYVPQRKKKQKNNSSIPLDLNHLLELSLHPTTPPRKQSAKPKVIATGTRTSTTNRANLQETSSTGQHPKSKVEALGARSCTTNRANRQETSSTGQHLKPKVVATGTRTSTTNRANLQDTSSTGLEMIATGTTNLFIPQTSHSISQHPAPVNTQIPEGNVLNIEPTISDQTLPICAESGVDTLITEGYVVNIQQPDADRIIREVSDVIAAACQKAVADITANVVTSVQGMLAKTAATLEMQIDGAMRSNTVDQHSEASSSFQFKLMKTTHDIDILEANLEDEKYGKQLFIYMKRKLGNIGDACNGLNISYDLVDFFFDRDVMLDCSWTGESRGATRKYAMQNCKNILDIFFDLVHSVNNTFSRSLLENFFKRVTRNAKKRAEAKRQRQSTVHIRAKKKKVVDRMNDEDGVRLEDGNDHVGDDNRKENREGDQENNHDDANNREVDAVNNAEHNREIDQKDYRENDDEEKRQDDRRGDREDDHDDDNNGEDEEGEEEDGEEEEDEADGEEEDEEEEKDEGMKDDVKEEHLDASSEDEEE